MKILALPRRRLFTRGLLAGLVAGVIATALMLFLNVTLHGISLPEVFGSALTQLMPPPLFDYLHQLIGADAKYYLFYGIMVGQCLVFALSGGLCALLVATMKQGTQQWLHWTTGIIVALVLWLLTGFVFMPLTGAGLFGAQLVIGLGDTMLSLAVVGLTFGLLFVSTYNWLLQRYLQTYALSGSNLEENLSRRTILWRVLEVAGIGVLGVLAWRFISDGFGAGIAPSNNAVKSRLATQFTPKIVPPHPQYGEIHPAPLLSSEITPNDRYYIVSKNLFSDPVVDAANWSLRVEGEVMSPYTLTYQGLLALPRKQQYESMMCISNEVGGQYMSNALWKGIPLADLLARAGGVKPGASKVVLYAVDDYSDSIHLTKAVEPTTLVAVRMNGQTLPQGHGFPARLLVPGIYGMKHVKWITRIEVVNSDYQGYWQQRGWSDAAPIRMTARIDTPLIGSTLPAGRLTYIAGVAFSGDKGISEVDVSLDAGTTWQKALPKRPLSALTWVLWELVWQPAKGSYTIVVRAIDMEGNVQDPAEAPPLPDGSSGYHTISVDVM
ncbi:MAG: molybdopterin-dependent oxidoreductase [Ktedonobacteraceae bacterium]|nr:molybdopterin-dependent oxidoreductase [Ktedonobacteraceae bacterium]